MAPPFGINDGSITCPILSFSRRDNFFVTFPLVPEKAETAEVFVAFFPSLALSGSPSPDSEAREAHLPSAFSRTRNSAFFPSVLGALNMVSAYCYRHFSSLLREENLSYKRER